MDNGTLKDPYIFASYLEPFKQNHGFMFILTTSPDLNFISNLC